MSIYGDFFLLLAHPLRVPNVVVKFFAFPGVVVAVIARRNRGKNEAKGKPRSERETERCCVIFVNLTGPLPPTTPCSSRTRGPHRDGTLPTSAPDSPPPLPRRSEVNRRRGLKTTPTLSQRPSLPRLLNIVSLRTLLHRPPNHPSLPPFHPHPFSLPFVRPSVRLSHSFSLSPSRLALTSSSSLSLRRAPPHVSLPLPPRPPCAPTTATKHERRRIFIVTSRAASSDLSHPPSRPP